MISIKKIQTKPYTDQNPGTSGLRKRVTVFMQENYIANFVQSIFDCLDPAERTNKVLVLSGDGRYYNKEAIQIIIRVAAANGVGKVVIGENGLLSTPAVSALIRELNAHKTKPEEECFGGIILTASHNPGGAHGDFGIKFNSKNGGPALEALTKTMFEKSKVIVEYKIAELSNESIPIDKIGKLSFGKVGDFTHDFHVEIISATEGYVNLLRKIFDFEAIKKLLQRKDFRIVFDGLSGVSGIYAKALFLKEFGLKPDSLLNCEPLPDFGGGHPDPNLTYAERLVEIMGLKPEKVPEDIPDFGAACDGDADRNMVLGRKFFVTPSDSLAVIAANYKAIPYFAAGLKGLARSMPTSGALDKVSSKLGLEYREVPTGWKFFGNLMDADKLSICGEESFGTGSDHIREKDGLWAILAWLSVLAAHNKDTPEGKLVTVEHIVRQHWSAYGRNYYSRYDYENLETELANKIFDLLDTNMAVFEKANPGNKARDFEYVDPIDGSISKHQGYIFSYPDGSRFVFRKSGTGTVGATIRIYLEKYSADNLDLNTAEALKEITADALKYSQIHEISGRDKPTVIT